VVSGSGPWDAQIHNGTGFLQLAPSCYSIPVPISPSSPKDFIFQANNEKLNEEMQQIMENRKCSSLPQSINSKQ
jgi:hypothetical protein